MAMKADDNNSTSKSCRATGGVSLHTPKLNFSLTSSIIASGKPASSATSASEMVFLASGAPILTKLQ